MMYKHNILYYKIGEKWINFIIIYLYFNFLIKIFPVYHSTTIAIVYYSIQFNVLKLKKKNSSKKTKLSIFQIYITEKTIRVVKPITMLIVRKSTRHIFSYNIIIITTKNSSPKSSFNRCEVYHKHFIYLFKLLCVYILLKSNILIKTTLLVLTKLLHNPGYVFNSYFILFFFFYMPIDIYVIFSVIF